MSSKNKLLIVGNICNLGYGFAQRWRKRGIDVTLIVTTHKGVDTTFPPKSDFPSWIKIYPTNTVLDIIRLRQEAKKYNEIHALTLAPMYLQGLGVPLYSYCTGSDMREYAQKNGFFPALLRRAYRKSKELYVVNPDLIGYARSIGLRAQYIPFAVCDEFDKEKAVKKFIFMPARWDSTKNLRVGLEGYLLARRKGLKVHLLVVNAPKWAEEKGVVNIAKVRYPGIMASLYNSSFVVLDQFKFGVAGMITHEALACGVPVITYVNERIYRRAGSPPPKVLNALTPEDVCTHLLSVCKVKKQRRTA